MKELIRLHVKVCEARREKFLTNRAHENDKKLILPNNVKRGLSGKNCLKYDSYFWHKLFSVFFDFYKTVQKICVKYVTHN